MPLNVLVAATTSLRPSAHAEDTAVAHLDGGGLRQNIIFCCFDICRVLGCLRWLRLCFHAMSRLHTRCSAFLERFRCAVRGLLQQPV